MKRSELLEKLTNLLSFNRYLTADVLSDGILEFLETEIGMLPPKTKKKKYWTSDELNTSIGTVAYYEEVNEWEPETTGYPYDGEDGY